MNQAGWRRNRATVLSALPWILSALGFAVAAGRWFSPGPPAPEELPAGAQPSSELDSLRLALASAMAENSALRRELDHLIGTDRRQESEDPSSRNENTETKLPPAAPSRLSGLSSRIVETLSRAAAGDAESARQGAMALLEVLRGGPEALEELRTAYLSTADPKARMMMLPTLIFAGGEAAGDFVAAQARAETDAELRRALVAQAAALATPERAEAMKDVFLEAARAEADPQLRVSAIRGLRYVRGPEAQELLFEAASDPSEDVRLAAIESLASRPGLRKQLRGLLEQESSSHVREIGECRLLLADSLG